MKNAHDNDARTHYKIFHYYNQIDDDTKIDNVIVVNTSSKEGL
jgi:hypothetical protein